MTLCLGVRYHWVWNMDLKFGINIIILLCIHKILYVIITQLEIDGYRNKLHKSISSFRQPRFERSWLFTSYILKIADIIIVSYFSI